jgi:YesN/AraC family two-component response regulator
MTMYKMFIVDDNKYERNGIRDDVDWGSLGVEVVGMFANGAEALANVEALRPDLIVTDIAMPTMNGVALAERVRERYPDIKMIFTSCHSDFDFAKSAVDLGIYGYVLKPIISDELETAVRKLVAEMTERERGERERAGMLRQLEGMLPLVQEQFFKEMLLGNFRGEEDIRERIEFLRVPVPVSASLAVLSVRFAASEDGRGPSVVDAYYQSYTFKKLVASLEPPESAYPVQMASDLFAVVLFGAPDSFMETAVALHTAVSQRIDAAFTIGMSKTSPSLASIAELYRQSEAAVRTTFYDGGHPIIAYAEVEDASERNVFGDMPELEAVYGDVKSLLSYDGADGIDEFLDKYLNVPGASRNEGYIKAFAFLALNLASVLLMEVNKSFQEMLGEEPSIWGRVDRLESAAEARALLRRSFASIKERLIERNPTKHLKLVETVREIVKQRYGEPITVEDISKSLYMSGRHANHIFKKETGQTIFDYLVEYRLGIAKRLLQQPDSKVAVVAEQVGYLNTSYFCLAFKKHVGMTPAEYKSKLVLR